MLITRKSGFSGKTHTKEIDVTQEQIDQWQGGNEPIQNVMPHLSPDDREFLMTGITPEEWAETFGGDDDDVEPKEPLSDEIGDENLPDEPGDH